MLRKAELKVSHIPKVYYPNTIHSSPALPKVKARLEEVKLSRSEKKFLNGGMVTGMMVKRKDDFEYFSKYFQSNWLQIQGCYLTNLNYKEKKFQSERPNLMIGLFYPFLGGALGIVGAVLLFGLGYEILRRRHAKKTKSVEGQVEGDAVTCNAEAEM